MARDLGDVADYFLPRVGAVAPPLERAPAPLERPAALPILALPAGARDVVRAAFAWNLAVEISRLGATAVLLAPRESEPSPVWPESGTGPLDTEVALCDAPDLASLGRSALDLAVARAAECDFGIVL